MTTAVAARARRPADDRPHLRPVAMDHRRVPRFTRDLVSRPRLVDALMAGRAAPLALVTAPAGYGKTTLLAEWAERDPRPFAWATLGPAQDDRGRLERAVAGALSAVNARAPYVLVLDGVEAVQQAEALDVLTGLIDSVPHGSQLALGARAEPGLPLGRLRAQRSLVEIRASDLAMTKAEGLELLAGVGVDAGPVEVETLVGRTEGWPVGLYLAARSLQEVEASSRAGATEFGGGDRFVADYVRDEILAWLGEDAVAFLRRASVLERLSGPLCDAVLGRRGSAALLRDLARANTMLVALDHREEAFRLHRLFAETLSAELRRLEPDEVAGLHRRASEWHEAHGELERAIHHAVEAGDATRSGELLLAGVPAFVSSGRNGTMQRWLRAFTDQDIAAQPALALAAAHSHLARGELDGVQRWETAARRVLRSTEPADRADGHEAGVALLRAARAPDGLRQMAQDAARAFGLEPADSPWRAYSSLLLGVSEHLLGDRARAETLLEDGVRRGAVAAPNVQALCLAQLALMAAEREDWESGASFAGRAVAQVEHYHLAAYPTSALVFAASSVVRVRRGRVEQARDDLRQAERLLAMLTDFAPWYEAETRLAMARTTLRIRDVSGARGLLAAAECSLRRLPDGIVLREWADELRVESGAACAAVAGGGSSLTTAELRILAFLPTHLSFREIAGRLFVSANTVKTQAHAVYRKLDASSRSEAVTRATALGLIDT